MNPSIDDKIIDLCCSPGAKLLEISDRLGPNGLVVGNDISKQRLQICLKFLKKHQIKNIQLLNEDATTLVYKDTLFDKVLCDVECSHDGSLKHILKFIEKCGEQKVKKAKITEDEKRSLILKDKSISNTERKRRLVQHDSNREKSKEDTSLYFSNYKNSNFQDFLKNRNGLVYRILPNKSTRY